MLPMAQVTSVNLTRRARRVMDMAKTIAAEYGLGYVGTEHLLLGILREGTSIAAACLNELGADEERTRAVVNELVRERMEETWVMGRLPGTPHYRDVLTKAQSLAKGTGNWQVCSVHLLLGLLQEKESMGHRALARMGLSRELVKTELSKRI